MVAMMTILDELLNSNHDFNESDMTESDNVQPL